MGDVETKVQSRTREIEAKFAKVETAPPSAYMTIGNLKSAPPPSDDVMVISQKVFFVRVDSAGITDGQGAQTCLLENYPGTPEEAYEAWSVNMDRFLAEHPSRDVLYWRKAPELESDRDYEAGTVHWNVYSRLAVM